MPIATHHVVELREQGYTVLPDFVPPEIVGQAQSDALALFPPEADVRADPRSHHVHHGLMFRTFPYQSDALNALPLRDDVLDFGSALFDGRQVFLTQHLLRASFGGLGDVDQNLHRDYSDNSLLVPSDDPAFGQVAFLVYLTDVTLDDAPTFICPRPLTDDRPLWPRERMRDTDPEIYAIERPIEGAAGTAIAYTMATFHRGSKFARAAGFRLAVHFVLRPAGCEWMAFSTFPRAFESEVGRDCMAKLSPRQRSALGVPPPGDPYWTPATVGAMSLRYPGIDVSPYSG